MLPALQQSRPSTVPQSQVLAQSSVLVPVLVLGAEPGHAVDGSVTMEPSLAVQVWVVSGGVDAAVPQAVGQRVGISTQPYVTTGTQGR